MILNNIRNKISLTYIAFALVILAAIMIIIDLEMEAGIKDNIEDQLLNHIDLLDHYFTDTKAVALEELNAAVKDHAKQSEIRVTLIDSAGKVLLDSDVDFNKLPAVENHLRRPEILLATIYGIGKDTRLSKTTGHEYFYVARRLTNNSIPHLPGLWFIRASLSLQNMQNKIADVQRSVLTAGIVVLALVLALSLYISRRITKPLLRIISRVDEISKGKFDLKVDVGSNDEMKMLSDSINRLTGTINADLVELERLAKVRSQFLANVSHELRTPLFSMQAFLETLLKGAINDPEVNRKYLTKALSNVDRLNFLLNDLIEISRIESGELKLSFRYFPASELFALLQETFREQCERKQIKLVIQNSGALQVYGDKSKLQQVFSNLIDNAIKYNPPGTTIKIYYSTEKELVRFFVEDNGIGIAEEHLPRLFERFYRIDKERSRETGGTGLGLAIVKHIVEAHESSITVSSIPAKGTIFSFSLKI